MKYSIIDIFCRPKIEEAVEKTHDCLVFKKIKTLREFMAMPVKWEDSQTHLIPDIVKVMEGENPIFAGKGFNLDMPAIGYLELRSNFLKLPEVAEIADVTRPSMKKIVDASLLAKKPMELYPFKTFIMTLGLEDEYYGLLPNTSHCEVATKRLFGENFKNNPYGHTLFCRDIAFEIKRTPMYVNTALWLLGQE